MQLDPNTKKNALYSLFLVIFLVGIWWYRDIKEGDDVHYKVEISGETMGTTYRVKYLYESNVDHKEEIDSLLLALNNSLSTYIPESEISQFNEGSILKYESGFFYPVGRSETYGTGKAAQNWHHLQYPLQRHNRQEFYAAISINYYRHKRTQHTERYL